MPSGCFADPLTREAIGETLRRMGLISKGEQFSSEPLSGGVSSDIWRIAVGNKQYCLKRALPRLKVPQVWEAPVERNGFESQWFRTAGAICPRCVPNLLAQDLQAGLFVMDYLDPGRYPIWKNQLRDGIVCEETAERVAERLARIHAATSDDKRVACQFATDDAFYAIRLEPYLIATGRVHRDLAPRLEALARRTAETRLALVHGDVSPKNILIGPRNPVFLDAECACYGDPAFDLAFCLNHLLLKCLWTPAAARGFLACFDRLGETYLGAVGWEPRAALEARAARLLPGLFLARVDGKSPVEYLTAAADKARVRRVARAFLARPDPRLAAIREAWAAEVGA